MIDLVLGIVIIIILVAMNGHLWEINKQLRRYVPPEKKETTEPFVTRSDPAFVNENMAGQGDSAIVTPKSPQLVEWEEQEELRKMSLRGNS